MTYNPFKVKPFHFAKPRKPRVSLLPSHVSIEMPEEESLYGSVQGKQASAPEERLARELDRAGKSYFFRYVLGAPKGLPGWKELDFLIFDGGLLYAVEVDTAFTHRNKEQKDRLHDALILTDPHIQAAGTLYPHVFHASGDDELNTQAGASLYVKTLLGR